MEIIYTAESLKQCENTVREFEKNYNTAFPDDDEREDFNIIRERINEKTFRDDPKTFLVLENSSGLIAEYYPSCGSILLTYIVVSENSRGKGIARKLMQQGVLHEIAKIIFRETGEAIRAVFFESNNPLKTSHDSFDPTTRLSIFKRMGAKLIDIPYVQPSLGAGKDRVDNLFLFTFPLGNQDFIKTDIVLSFLTSFYKELGVANPESDPDFICMKKALPPHFTPLSEVPVPEQPEFRFCKASVAVHIPFEIDIEIDDSCRFYNSFETDLFSYQHQKSESKPFRNYCLNAHQPIDADILFPDRITFQSEGRTESLIAGHSESDKVVGIKLYVTLSCFPGHSVFSFIFQPAEHFTEYDIIRISTLFGSKQENVAMDLFFRMAGDTEMRPGKFFRAVAEKMIIQNQWRIKSEVTTFALPEPDMNDIVTGTVNVCFDPAYTDGNVTGMDEFFGIIHSAQTKEPESVKQLAEAYSSRFANVSNVMCGLALGIFDFHRMEFDEFTDTIMPLLTNQDSFIVLNRGILLQAYTGAETRLTYNTIGSDPYIIIPSVLLVSREFEINRALKAIKASNQKSPGVYALNGMINNAETIVSKTGLGYFQYENEKTIYTHGISERRLNDLTQTLNEEISSTRDKLDLVKFRRATVSDNLIALFLIILSIFQLQGIIKSIIQINENTSSGTDILELRILGFLTFIAISAYVLKIRGELKR